MKVALSILACLLVANAAVLPQKGLGVTKEDIDNLIKDLAIAYRNGAKKLEPISFGSNEIPIEIEGLNVKAIDAKVWIGDTIKYLESSHLTDEELDISLEFVQKDVKVAAGLHITGTYQGKPVDQKGQLGVLMSTAGQKNTWKVQLLPFVTLVNIDGVPEVGDISISVSDIRIDGVSKSDLESAIAESIKKSFVENQISQDDLEAFNKLIGKHSLQEVYDFLRNTTPSS